MQGAAGLAAPLQAGPHEVVHGTTTLAGDEILAPFVFGGWLFDEFFERRGAAGLADGMFAGTGLAGAKGACEGSG